MLSLRPIRRLYCSSTASFSKPISISDEPALVKLKNERDPDKLFHLFQANSRNRLVIENRFAFEDTISRLAGARRFDYIQQLLDYQLSLPQGRREGFVVRIIMLYGKAGMVNQAVDTFYNMHLFRCSCTVKSFNAALKVLTQTRDLNAVHLFLNEVSKKFSIERDIFSLNIAIKGFCDMGFLDSAYLVMIEMEKVGIRPDVITYTTLISAFYKENKFEIGNGLWNLMILRRCYPNLTTFNVRIQYLINKTLPWQANKLTSVMQRVGIEPDDMTFNLIIKGFFQAGFADMAKNIYFSLHRKGYKPNCKIYQTMVHYLCKTGDFDLACTLSKYSMSKNWFPSVDTVCKLLEGLSKKPKDVEAKTIMELIRKRVPPFSVKEIGTFENILSRTGKVDY